jgi:hypothetical protein
LGTAARDASNRQTNLSFEITKKEKDLAMRNWIATHTDPNNPFNPLHPDETSVSVACLSGF